MPAVHNDSVHPLAGMVVTPTNAEIAKTYGPVRIEDWADRVHSNSWRELIGVNDEAANYNRERQNLFMKTRDNIAMIRSEENEVVLAYTNIVPSRVVFLHNSWLPTLEEVQSAEASSVH